jgi:hypothetical protein
MIIRRMRFACCVIKGTDARTHTHNTYSFFTATMVTRTHPNIMLYGGYIARFVSSEGYERDMAVPKTVCLYGPAESSILQPRLFPINIISRLSFKYLQFMADTFSEIVIRRHISRAVMCKSKWVGYLWKSYLNMGIIKFLPSKFQRYSC